MTKSILKYSIFSLATLSLCGLCDTSFAGTKKITFLSDDLEEQQDKRLGLLGHNPLAFAKSRLRSLEALGNSEDLRIMLESIVRKTAFKSEDFFSLSGNPENYYQLKKNLAARSLLDGYFERTLFQKTTPFLQENHAFLNELREVLSGNFKRLSHLSETKNTEEGLDETDFEEKVKPFLRQPLWVSFFPDKELWSQQAHFFSHVGDYAYLTDLDELEHFTKTFLKLYPEESEEKTTTFKALLHYFSYVCMMKGREERELSFLERYGDQEPYKLPLAEALQRNKRFQEALTVLEPLLEKDKDISRKSKPIKAYSETVLQMPFDEKLYAHGEAQLEELLGTRREEEERVDEPWEGSTKEEEKKELIVSKVHLEKKKQELLTLKAYFALFTRKNEEELLQILRDPLVKLDLRLAGILSHKGGISILPEEAKRLLLAKAKEYFLLFRDLKEIDHAENEKESLQVFKNMMNMAVLNYDSFFEEICVADPTGESLEKYTELKAHIQKLFKKAE